MTGPTDASPVSFSHLHCLLNLIVLSIFSAFLTCIMENDIAETVRGRKRVRNPDAWSRNVRKRQRNAGKEYTGRTGKLIPPKQFDPSIDCCRAPRNRKRKGKTSCLYATIPEEDREDAFIQFWGLGTYNLQNAHLFGLIDKSSQKRPRNRKLPGESRRQFSYQYHVRTLSGQRLRVCYAAFRALFQVSDDRLRTVRSKFYFSYDFKRFTGVCFVILL